MSQDLNALVGQFAASSEVYSRTDANTGSDFGVWPYDDEPYSRGKGQFNCDITDFEVTQGAKFTFWPGGGQPKVELPAISLRVHYQWTDPDGSGNPQSFKGLKMTIPFDPSAIPEKQQFLYEKEAGRFKSLLEAVLPEEGSTGNLGQDIINVAAQFENWNQSGAVPTAVVKIDRWQETDRKDSNKKYDRRCEYVLRIL